MINRVIKIYSKVRDQINYCLYIYLPESNDEDNKYIRIKVHKNNQKQENKDNTDQDHPNLLRNSTVSSMEYESSVNTTPRDNRLDDCQNHKTAFNELVRLPTL